MHRGLQNRCSTAELSRQPAGGLAKQGVSGKRRSIALGHYENERRGVGIVGTEVPRKVPRAFAPRSLASEVGR
jgi:hypothetical protein